MFSAMENLSKPMLEKETYPYVVKSKKPLLSYTQSRTEMKTLMRTPISIPFVLSLCVAFLLAGCNSTDSEASLSPQEAQTWESTSYHLGDVPGRTMSDMDAAEAALVRDVIRNSGMEAEAAVYTAQSASEAYDRVRSILGDINHPVAKSYVREGAAINLIDAWGERFEGSERMVIREATKVLVDSRSPEVTRVWEGLEAIGNDWSDSKRAEAASIALEALDAEDIPRCKRCEGESAKAEAPEAIAALNLTEQEQRAAEHDQAVRELETLVR